MRAADRPQPTVRGPACHHCQPSLPLSLSLPFIFCQDSGGRETEDVLGPKSVWAHVACLDWNMEHVAIVKIGLGCRGPT